MLRGERIVVEVERVLGKEKKKKKRTRRLSGNFITANRSCNRVFKSGGGILIGSVKVCGEKG